MNKTVLIIGSGGREHALGWKFSQSPHVGKIYFAPGNGGTQLIGENVDIESGDIKGLVDFAKNKNIDLTFVGPEVALVAGIVDEFKKYKKLKIFGPDKEAAQLEGSKPFAIEFMKRYGIPQPKSRTYYNPIEIKKAYQDPIKYSLPTSAGAVTFNQSWSHDQKLDTYAQGTVIKAGGLAAGKGVVLPNSYQEAINTIDDMMIKKKYGEAGRVINVETEITGREVSIIAFTDGKTIVPLVASQDHKRVDDHDQGKNTGGMGAYAPVPDLFFRKQDWRIIQEEILEKTIQGLKKEGIIYHGILYAGLMLTKDGPKVLEYNVRFGDPETQPLMMLLNSDLYELSMACIEGRLTKEMVNIKRGASVCVVLTAKGYPDPYEKGKEIKGLNTIKDHNIQVFHAGTVKKDGKVFSSGGRVLGITTYESNIKNACARAYSAIGENGINFDGMHYRKDIAHQALNYDQSN